VSVRLDLLREPLYSAVIVPVIVASGDPDQPQRFTVPS